MRRVAGELGDDRDDDALLPWLAITADPDAADPDALTGALAGADLVVVENLCSLPLNLGAARAAARALARHPGRVVFHHHDLPWQRPDLAGVLDFPPDLPGALHVTINERSRTELADRGHRRRSTVHNRFDFDAAPGDRDATRERFGFAPSELVLLQPTRAIPRKNVGAGLDFAGALAPLVPERSLRYWLTGAAEDGYADELQLARAGRHGRAPARSHRSQASTPTPPPTSSCSRRRGRGSATR